MPRKPIDMCSGPLLGNIIRYTIPIILTGLLQLLFNAADLVVVGQFCGSHSVGAVGATGSIINLIVNLFIGLSVGAGVTVAHHIGAGNEEETGYTVHTAIPLAAVSGLLLTVVGLAVAPVLLRWMDTPDDLLTLSTLYVQVYFCGMIPSMLYNYGAAILRAAGDSRSPLIFLTIAGAVNVVLNIIFVTVIDMDVAGVALATVLSQVLSAVLTLWVLARRTDACRLEWRRMCIHARSLGRMLRIGLPAGIQGSMFSISNVIIQSTVNSFGAVVVSGASAAGNLEGFAYVAMNSFQQAAMNFTGQNVGALRYDRVRRIMRTCLVSVAVTGVVTGGLLYAFGQPLLGLYITDSQEAIGYGMLRLAIIGLFYFICGMMEVATGVIRGMGVSVAPMLVTVLGVCGFRLVWIWGVFPQLPSLECLYISYPISWAITFLVEMVIYAVIIHHRRRPASGGNT